MARAKRTDRAEARRRYRAELATEAVGVEGDDEAAQDAPAAGRRSQPVRPTARAPRPSAMKAFRDAYQPADIRADLRAIPELLRSRAVYLPALLVLISTVIYIVATKAEIDAVALTGAGASPAASAAASPTASGVAGTGVASSGSILSVIGAILALLFLQTPPIGGIYIAGVLAKRSSYLAGGIAGLLGGLGYAVYVLTLTLPPSMTPANFDQTKAQVVGQALFASPVFGIVIGAGLGYYRRLLRNMNPTPDRTKGTATDRGRSAARRR
ncbi:MAG TPA: hypothetical protein VK656_06995 [Candidatus Acidoferrum sp.]|nr:hypothetical protein [Candidatus Acidoferrum sp.]